MYTYQEMLSILNNGGYRLTDQRLSLLQVLETFGGSFSALDFEKKANEMEPSIGRATLFRAIDLFLEQGILEKIHRENGDDVYIVGSKGHHHHIICRDCGEIRDIDACPFEKELEEVIQREGFSSTIHRIEIEGICESCRKKGEGKN
ncbi:Fur family transcriptional regulator [Leptospirillum ferriphilum]|jgi:Fe2+ or Zn2+ uptake regulation protein|uniref:Fur family transcriptional regulator n=3 Tax=Leptospirillum ferriphilum TaxID=178606 RepID=A0A059XP85_9BACT|nr:Fur family transcriptional regulator [Leptospirillum ferriphilum]AFS53316.1 Putative ferric uptake regulator, Fur family [Leptospirillum ferriphilum ML-04]AIA30359.1 Fur family transcriptional regulator [Leptospirillum ferriphilum YSK]MCL4405895.1 transcriptional repressor [Bacillota bacterium]MCL5259965.1 transcriptional repressor [Nitrospirota bacterium]